MTMEGKLLACADALKARAARLDDPEFRAPLDALQTASDDIGRAWSGSALGYHARVYFRDLLEPPPDNRFSVEWGLKPRLSGRRVEGWELFDPQTVTKAIRAAAGDPDIEGFKDGARAAREAFEEGQSLVTSQIVYAMEKYPSDSYIKGIAKEVAELSVGDVTEYINHRVQGGQFMTRDVEAAQAGLKSPPHITEWAVVQAIRQPYAACGELAKLARRLATHLKQRTDLVEEPGGAPSMKKHVFIGHGGSPTWREFKDFIQDRLKLPWEEFNRVPVAGITTVDRLNQMLDASAIAFLIMTAEDERADGAKQARMNVIHEVGLFQGRYGFKRAIVLLEHGCEEFSNIAGLGQIRFPPGKIRSAFEEVREVLEREGFVS